MAKKSRLIPFWWLPGSWGLTGRLYAEAEAGYYYDGEELDRRLNDVNNEGNPAAHARRSLEIDFKHQHITAWQYDRQKWKLENPDATRNEELLACARIDFEHGRMSELDFDMQVAMLTHQDDEIGQKVARFGVLLKYGQMTEYDHDVAVAELTHEDENERQLAMLDIELEHGRIDATQHAKQRANVLDEPWIDIVDHGYDPERGISGVYFEFDWNDAWINYLRMNGYGGNSEEEIVERWFADVCRVQAESVDQPQHLPANMPFNSGMVVTRARGKNGGALYS